MNLPTPYRHHPFETKCRSCGALIVWFKTSSGRSMPVNAETTKPTDAQHQLDLKRHVSHFSTCPNANQHRKSPLMSLLKRRGHYSDELFLDANDLRRLEAGDILELPGLDVHFTGEPTAQSPAPAGEAPTPVPRIWNCLGHHIDLDAISAIGPFSLLTPNAFGGNSPGFLVWMRLHDAPKYFGAFMSNGLSPSDQAIVLERGNLLSAWTARVQAIPHP